MLFSLYNQDPTPFLHPTLSEIAGSAKAKGTMHTIIHENDAT